MKLSKKLNMALIMVLVFSILLASASYAWLVISTRPEVGNITTNVGANGSLEIALLNQDTFLDPTLIKTGVGTSAEKRDPKQANETWGNTIDLLHGYGLEQISLLPAQLNLSQNGQGGLAVGNSILKIADYGIDGRIKILSDKTVSAVMTEEKFAYKVDRQSYGVRGIGTVSNISAQQTALATARSMVRLSASAAPRALENAWRQYGGGIMDVLYRHYALGEDALTQEDVLAVRGFLLGLQQAAEYVEDATRYTVIGVMAAHVQDGAEFERQYWLAMPGSGMKLSGIAQEMSLGEYAGSLREMAEAAQALTDAVQQAADRCDALAKAPTWENFRYALEELADPERMYLNGAKLSEPMAFDTIAAQNELLPAERSALSELARFAGNYSVFSLWENSVTVTLTSVAVMDAPRLDRQKELLDRQKAAAGGWTQANMNQLYGFALDLALRCNEPSQLLLQTAAAPLAEGETEDARYGGGSYMYFQSDNMNQDQLVSLMDALRVAFVSDQNELLAVAKPGNYHLDGSYASAGLYLYDYHLEIDGSLTVGARKESDAILELPQNTPVVITAVVWLDGDQVDNGMVIDIFQHSMTGGINIQFSSSANLISSQQTLKND